MTGAKLTADHLFDPPGDRRPSELLQTLLAHVIQASHDTCSDHISFQFAEHVRHLHHRLAERDRAVDRLRI